MKKLLQIIMIGIMLFFVWIAEQEISNNQIIQIGDMDETYAAAFSIPNNADVIAPDSLFSALLDVTESTGSNIFRTVLTDGENGGYELVKYALLSEDSAYMSAFEIENGRNLSTEDTRTDSDVYISTKDTGINEQVGTIDSNMINLDVTVYPLYQQFSYYKADGNYYVELGDGVTIDDFLNALAISIEANCGVLLSTTEFEGTGSSIGVPYTDTFTYYLLLSGIVLIFFFILIYYAIQDTKRISVMKLFGTNTIQMLRHFMVTFVVEGVILIAIISVGLVLQGYNVKYLLFILKKSSLFVGVLLICLAMVYSFVINHVNIASGLKGDRKGRVIYYLNTMAKIICICAVIYCGQSVYSSVR